MKFLYEFQDKSNKRHTGSLSAPTRADAFAALKGQGIKPIRCVEAPGLFNLIFGRGKRWLAIGVLALLLVAVFIAKIGADRRAARSLHEAEETLHVFDSPTRRQIVGDAAVIEKGIRTGWADVFDSEGDRFLASFAIPGVKAAVGTTSVAAVEDALKEHSSHRGDSTTSKDGRALQEGRATSMKSPLGIEARQIIAMVEGMKMELRRFLASGGTIVEYGERLVRRQEEEMKYYNLAKRDIEYAIESGKSDAEVIALWEKHNGSLRKMGIRLVPLPEE